MGNERNQDVFSARMAQVIKYLHLTPFNRPAPNSAETIRILAAKDLVRDYDRIFDFYKGAVGFEACAKNVGVRMRERNTVVEAWPMRLKKKPGEEGAEEEFQRLMASSSSGAPRYVEWVRKV